MGYDMIAYRKIRWITFAFCLFAIIGTTLYSSWKEQQYCMGVPFISDNALAEYKGYCYQDLSENLLFNEEKAPIDVNAATIYISQDIKERSKPWNLDGFLTISDNDWELYFLDDPAFGDLETAMKNNHTFTLIVANKTQTYMRYNVVFTTLPVMRLDGEYAYTNEEYRDVISGEICLWSPNDPELGVSSVKAGNAQWHLRGRSAQLMPKLCWKISLQDSNGDKRNETFLGLGSDDDWILNAMSRDHTKLKEQLFMKLWNELASQTDWNLNMSKGEYVEVVINGSYCGLYLLQRRVDEKYLELNQEDILLKGKVVTNDLPTLEECYEIQSTPYDAATTYSIAEDLLAGESVRVHLNNYVDVNLFLRFFGAHDNLLYTNMYFALLKEYDEYQVYLIPWDTDLSFGTYFTEEGTNYYALRDNVLLQDEEIVHLALDSFYRREHAAMLNRFPDLNSILASRWKELRESVLALEHIRTYIRQIKSEFVDCSAFARDQIRWGEFYSGTDTWDALNQNIEELLLLLDTYYAGNAA